jgi:hypothetical protein
VSQHGRSSSSAAEGDDGRANIGDEQVDYVRRVLEQNPSVRWTFVFLHKPAWDYESKNFERIDQLLAGRQYTVFAGHHHYYEYNQRNGRDYLEMGAAGKIWHRAGPGNVDHVTLVTMTPDGPQIANVLLNGVFDREGPE